MFTTRALTLTAACVLTALSLSVPAAQAASNQRTIHYEGITLRVPAGWPVFHVSPGSPVCVRFNRHAVYLGTPGSDERCPVDAIGRTEAILAQPLGRGAGAEPIAGQLVLRAGQVAVTATWGRDPALIGAALGLPTQVLERRAAAAGPSLVRAVRRAPLAHAAATNYTGRAFDACSAPSLRALRAWRRSPFRAVGVYIGGVNAACAQPNLTAGWVARAAAAGWHLIPTYVGLQAPRNGCGCAGITRGRAAAQGRAAARDAVAHAQALGLGAGIPIYFDMESYGGGRRNHTAVLTFLAAWTGELHALGYRSGVYTSASSGVADLVARYGTGYREPDELWFAAWDNRASTASGSIPAGDWSAHQRLHQYAGDHFARYGGVTLDIDSDYVDGATSGARTVAARPPAGSHHRSRYSVAPVSPLVTSSSPGMSLSASTSGSALG